MKSWIVPSRPIGTNERITKGKVSSTFLASANMKPRAYPSNIPTSLAQKGIWFPL